MEQKPWTAYVTELHDAFGYLFANWVPQEPIELGDYGKFQDGVFHKDGNIKNLGIDFQWSAPRSTRGQYQYHSANSSSGQMKISGSGQASGVVETKAGLEVKFAGANSVFFNAAGCSLRTVEDVGNLGDAVRQKIKQKTWDGQKSWDYDWVVITTVIDAISTTALMSNSNSASIVLEASADAATIDLADATARLGVHYESNIGLNVVTKPDCTPLFACHKAHWRILGPPNWQTSHLFATTLDADVPAQLEALRLTGQLEVDEFDFIPVDAADEA